MQKEKNLRKARTRADLERKQVATLLGQNSPGSISAYERGDHKPILKTALKLEVIYRTPLRILFESLFQDCKHEVLTQWQKYVRSLPKQAWFPRNREQLRMEEFCFYAEILKGEAASDQELEDVRKHSLAMVNTLTKHTEARAHNAGENLNPKLF